LRVANVDAAPGAPIVVPPAAGELRIVGTPASRAEAMARVADVVAVAGRIPVSGFSLADMEALAVREHVTLRVLLEELQATGLELIAEAPYDLLSDPRRSIEQVNIAGMILGRLTLHRLPSDDVPALYRQIGGLQYDVAVIRAFAPLPRSFNPAVPST